MTPPTPALHDKYTALLPFVILLLGTFFPMACSGAVVDHQILPRKNDGFSQALFRLWLPDDPGADRGIRWNLETAGNPFTEAPEWHECARKHQLAGDSLRAGSIPTTRGA